MKLTEEKISLEIFYNGNNYVNLGAHTIWAIKLKGKKLNTQIFQNDSQFANANQKRYRIQILHYYKKLPHYYLKNEKNKN